MNVLGIDHVSVIVKDADKAYEFYHEILGLNKAPRPDLGFAGHWLDLGSQQMIHLLQLENPYENLPRPEHGGRDMHFALRVKDVNVIKQKLLSKRQEFTESRSGRKALFFKDLDKNVIEVYQV